MGKVLLWVAEGTGKLVGQATKNPAKLRQFMGLTTATSSIISLRKGKRR